MCLSKKAASILVQFADLAECPPTRGRTATDSISQSGTSLSIGVPMYQPDRYPRNWRELSLACKQRANWQCEACHVTQGTQRISKRTGAVYPVYLHAAHTVLHDTSNPQPELQALCPTCHGKLDWQLRKQEAETTLEKRKHQLLLTCRK